jgi:PTS system mannose-specific IID component
VARSAEFFNSHPYLAGIAVGAVVRAERDGVPGPVISRFRTALSGPLGALGDQLIWAGEVPALVGFTLALVPFFGLSAVLAAVIVHNVIRFRLTAWGLDLGLREGLNVGAALQQSWLPGRAEDAQRLAAFAVGLAIPLAAWGLLVGLPLRGAMGVIAVVLVGSFLAVAPATRSRVTGLRIGLGLLAVALLYVGGFA